MRIPAGPSGGTATDSHPNGCYYFNGVTGQIQRQCNPLNAVFLPAAGYIGKGYVPATPFNAFQTWDDVQHAKDVWMKNVIGSGQDPISGILGGPKTPNFQAPVGPGSGSGGSGGSGDSGQSDWTNLMVRLAEFGIGAILVIIGFNAIVSRTKSYQRVETVVSGVARTAVK